MGRISIAKCPIIQLTNHINAIKLTGHGEGSWTLVDIPALHGACLELYEGLSVISSRKSIVKNNSKCLWC